MARVSLRRASSGAYSLRAGDRPRALTRLVKQIGALAAVIGAVLLAGYLVFTRLLVFPPLTLSLVSFASAGMLGLLRRSLVASSHLDRSIEDVKRAGKSLNAMSLGSAAESIARLADAEGVAIYTAQGGGRMRLVAAHGIRYSPEGLRRFCITVSRQPRPGTAVDSNRRVVRWRRHARDRAWRARGTIHRNTAALRRDRCQRRGNLGREGGIRLDGGGREDWHGRRGLWAI